MVQDSDSYRQLVQLYGTHREASAPRGISQIIGSDLDVDLHEEDAYLAGLIETFLKRGKLAVSNICIDRSIDRRLESVVESGNSLELREFFNYRSRMNKLAVLLAETTGVSINAELKGPGSN